ncbi:hypothetical protein PDE_00907 [Penicillium oxalicum 114-2]|uniref:Uncharacterized protein n=1 Tax=Penicillium oxalicum (strain 114-2 / CGMCC 5302) TaxID=933388 RepID=S7ZBB2_PENO1|nr:hypothetical protein PDE_00907 [Penicillium oxalicum 114-2]
MSQKPSVGMAPDRRFLTTHIMMKHKLSFFQGSGTGKVKHD